MTDPQAVAAPRTPTGKAYWDWDGFENRISRDLEVERFREAILAIEAEAIALGFADGRSTEQHSALADRLKKPEAAAPSELLRAALERIKTLQPKALGYLERYGFVMDRVGPLADDASELDRWKVLAFSLYTDLCEAELVARAALQAFPPTAQPESRAVELLRELTDWAEGEGPIGQGEGCHWCLFSAGHEDGCPVGEARSFLKESASEATPQPDNPYAKASREARAAAAEGTDAVER